MWMVPVDQDFSALALLTFGARWFFLVGGCPVHWGTLCTSLALTCWMPGVPPIPSGDNQKCLQTLLNVPLRGRLALGGEPLAWAVLFPAFLETGHQSVFTDAGSTSHDRRPGDAPGHQACNIISGVVCIQTQELSARMLKVGSFLWRRILLFYLLYIFLCCLNV